MTGLPAALRAFAFASTASVADSVIAAIRVEIRGFFSLIGGVCQTWGLGEREI